MEDLIKAASIFTIIVGFFYAISAMMSDSMLPYLLAPAASMLVAMVVKSAFTTG